MPILLDGRCYAKVKTAARALARRKGWGRKRAQAYVATVERRQRGSRRVARACR